LPSRCSPLTLSVVASIQRYSSFSCHRRPRRRLPRSCHPSDVVHRPVQVAETVASSEHGRRYTR
jgi:hypothetical protein